MAPALSVPLLAPTPAQAQLAFPGAVGYGAVTRGGRAGRVIEVTTLADAGPGSLREAIDASGARTVVFRVGGTIELTRPLTIDEPFITVAGQTAPGDGILLRGHRIVVHASEVILRGLRVRPGADAGSELDGILVYARSAGLENVVIDHCSVS